MWRDYPEYGRLDEVIVWNKAKYFVVNVFKIVSFWYHYMHYEAQPTHENRIVVPNELPWHWVFNLIKKEGK